KLPSKFSKKYKGQLPAVKLARLAVAIGKQNQGLCRHMIINAVKRVITISENAGIVGFFVDAKNVRVKDYYKKFGFTYQRIPSQMFLVTSATEIFDVAWLYDQVVCGKVPKIFCLDQVTDVHNGAAILRTAAFYGVDCLLISQKGNFGGKIFNNFPQYLFGKKTKIH
ncbi:MAG: hypothetical protein HQL68_07405, partial [Magnetococcales bacterium]|nr:hypothetical protein [Magnetococcales bacterium]